MEKKENIVEFNFTNDVIFKGAMERCPEGAISIIKEFVSDLKDIDINENVEFLVQEKKSGINLITTMYDVNMLVANSIVELEMQVQNVNYDLKARMAKYYVSLLNDSFEESDETKYGYRKTYCVWFLGFKLFKDNDVIREYTFYDKNHNDSLIEGTKIIIVEFAKFNKCGYNKNRWYDLFLTSDMNVLRGDPIMNKMADSIEELNNDREVRARIRSHKKYEYEMRARFEADTEQAKKEGKAQGLAEGKAQGLAEGKAQGMAEGKAQGMAEGKAQGMAEGKAQGMAEGKAQGLAEGKAQGLAEGKAQGLAEGKAQGLAEGENNKAIEIAKNLKGINLPIDQIVKATGLTKEEIESL